MAVAAAEMRVVICGGGVVGAACAYYLSLKGVTQITLVERAAVACHASGKAGGFLAKGWGSELMDCSFDLHAELGQVLSGTDYRSVETLQVHPRKLTEALVAAAQQRGTTLKVGVVEGIATDSGGGAGKGEECAVTGVRVDGEVLEADRVIIALGPWSSKAAEWLPGSIPRGISGQKYTSIVVPTQMDETTPHCLFTDSAAHVELYPRPMELYACGCPERTPVPDDPLTIEAHPDSVTAIGRVVAACSSTLGTADRLAHAHAQACYLPTSPDGEPLIGPVPSVRGAFVATGHSCWGILSAPATGLGIAELITAGKATSVDLSPYDPARFVKQ